VRRTAIWVIFAAAAALLFLTVWILIPAPVPLLLPLAVGAPEASPVLLVVGMLVAAIAGRYARHSRIARAGVVIAVAAALLSLVPVVQLPVALSRFDHAIANTTAPPPAEMPGDVRVTRGVPFVKGEVNLSLDVYQPPVAGTYPVIMQIYGGSWQRGAPASQEWFSRYFAARGYVVVAIDYRHAPEWIWPEQLDDVHAGLYWIRNEAPRFDADPSRIVVVGRSAGAQLAMRLAYRKEAPSAIRAVVNYYGPVDLAHGWRYPPRPDPVNVRGILEAFIGGTPDRKPEHYKHASPISYVSQTSAPTLSLYGARDHIVDARYGRMLDAALNKAGATSVLLELPWAEHSFDAVPNGMGRYVALKYTERFIAWAVSR
jgi:acetyl esterase/lipase